MTLKEFFESAGGPVALGFSGGVDSCFLLWAGKHYGADIRPYFVKTAFQPQFELEDARGIADFVGVRLNIIELDNLACRDIRANGPDRCYFCKRAIFGALEKKAKEDGCVMITDGTNASDDLSDRPGVRALRELEVRSPLYECGITKDEIRRMSKEAGLFTWDKPAYACLATRVETGVEISADILKRIEGAEEELKKLGFWDLRVRVRSGMACLQLKSDQFERAASMADRIKTGLSPYFKKALLDLDRR